MQENWQQLIQDFDSTKEYVLATIVATRGSTYRKTGTMMLISAEGKCTGLLSGGCLEADISMHAEEIFAQKQAKLLTYDLKADAELLWGLGLGCDGAIDILLQPLSPSNQHLGFAELIQELKSGRSGLYCLQVNEQQAANAWFIPSSLNDREEIKRSLAGITDDQAAGEWLVIPVTPVVSLLLCGAGPDAEPVVSMANQLGWNISLQDHRANNLARKEFSTCYQHRKLRAENSTPEHFHSFDGVIIMTHNLTNDGILLKHALAANVGYIGLLGPAGRRDKLLRELDFTASDVKNQVFGPIGLDIGGRSPQAIALSICAEIQQFISQKYQQHHFKPWRQ